MASTDPLVGRRQELDLLRRRLTDARAGSGQLVLVSGPAGIGKTRLVEELVAGAGDTPVGWGSAVTDAGMPALWPWVRAVRDLPGPHAAMSSLVAGGTPASGSADDAAAATFAADTSVLDSLADQAKAGPGLLIVLDDLQWADHATLRLLGRVATEIRRLPLLVVGTHRDTFAVHRAAEVVHLGPLSPSESVAVLSSAVDNADTATVMRAAKLSGGSPLYLRTLARVAADQLRGVTALDEAIGATPELRHLVATAMETAGQRTAAAVEALTVLGQEADLELIASLLGGASPGSATELLLPAVPAGLVEIAASAVRFPHGLVRDAVYASIPPDRRERLHRTAAELLECHDTVARDDRAAAVARHWLLAGEPSRATTWAVHAANAARAAGAYAEAAEYLQLAVDAGGVADQAELLLDLARVQYLAGQIPESLESCVRAAAEGERTDRATIVGRAAIIVQGIGHTPANNTLEDLCRRALRLLGDGADPALLARIEAQLACVLHDLGSVEEATDWSLRALDRAIASGDPNAELDAIRARAAAAWLPQHGEELVELGTRAIELADAIGRPLARLWAHVWRSDAAVRGADMPTAAREIAGIESLARRTGLPMVRWHLVRRQAAVAALTGRFDNARRLAAQAAEISEDWQDETVKYTHLAHTILLGMLRGDAAEVAPEWTDHVDIAAHLPPIGQSIIANALWLAGRRDEAVPLYESVLRAIGTEGDNLTIAAISQMVDLAPALGDAAGCRLLAERVDELLYRITPASGAGTVFYQGSSARMLAELHVGAGEFAAAIPLFEEGLQVDARLGAAPYLARGRFGLAAALDATGERPRALELARAALADARRVDMPGLVRAAESFLSAATPKDPLTAREREIANLVAQALTNREIAGKLVLSERTVESHVRNILAKTGNASRTEFTRWFLSQP